MIQWLETEVDEKNFPSLETGLSSGLPLTHDIKYVAQKLRKGKKTQHLENSLKKEIAPYM